MNPKRKAPIVAVYKCTKTLETFRLEMTRQPPKTLYYNRETTLTDNPKLNENTTCIWTPEIIGPFKVELVRVEEVNND